MPSIKLGNNLANGLLFVIAGLPKLPVQGEKVRNREKRSWQEETGGEREGAMRGKGRKGV